MCRFRHAGGLGAAEGRTGGNHGKEILRFSFQPAVSPIQMSPSREKMHCKGEIVIGLLLYGVALQCLI